MLYLQYLFYIIYYIYILYFCYMFVNNFIAKSDYNIIEVDLF